MISGRYTRIMPIAHGDGIPGGWMQGLRLERKGGRTDLVMDWLEFLPLAPSQTYARDGKIYERVQGEWAARRLRFKDVSDLVMDGMYSNPDQIPADHPARSLRGLMHWRTPQGKLQYIQFNGSDDPARLQFCARRNRAESCPPANLPPVEIERNWSPSIQLPARRIAEPGSLAVHQRFGGDPVAIHLSGKRITDRFFTGGLEHQGSLRPQVDAVLNLGEERSVWAASGALPDDRWVIKGEGLGAGMSVDEIYEEAGWVTERLNAGKRVLVHCWAGMNRSATICCAALILVEGLTFEQALARVRERHPWARPDSHHTLMLRYIAANRATSER